MNITWIFGWLNPKISPDGGTNFIMPVNTLREGICSSSGCEDLPVNYGALAIVLRSNKVSGLQAGGI